MDETVVGVLSVYDTTKYELMTEIIGCFPTMDVARTKCEQYLKDFKKELAIDYGDYLDAYVRFNMEYKVCKL